MVTVCPERIALMKMQSAVRNVFLMMEKCLTKVRSMKNRDKGIN